MPRSAVSGVRSSCEASARKRRSTSRDRSRLASIAFSVSASRPTSSSVPGTGSRRRGSPGALDLGRGVGEPRERPERAAQQNEDAERGERGRDDARENEEQTEVAERALGRPAAEAATTTAPPAAGPPKSASGAA